MLHDMPGDNHAAANSMILPLGRQNFAIKRHGKKGILENPFLRILHRLSAIRRHTFRSEMHDVSIWESCVKSATSLVAYADVQMWIQAR